MTNNTYRYTFKDYLNFFILIMLLVFLFNIIHASVFYVFDLLPKVGSLLLFIGSSILLFISFPLTKRIPPRPHYFYPNAAFRLTAISTFTIINFLYAFGEKYLL